MLVTERQRLRQKAEEALWLWRRSTPWFDDDIPLALEEVVAGGEPLSWSPLG